MLTMLKTLRKQKRLTQRELADALHISQTSVSKYERGESEPDLEMVVLMADYFGVTVDYLLGSEEETEEYPEMYFSFLKGAKELDLSKRDLDLLLDIARRFKKEDESG